MNNIITFVAEILQKNGHLSLTSLTFVLFMKAAKKNVTFCLFQLVIYIDR